MKFKKILAVALAATTALSSGVAYDMLGSGTAHAAYKDKDETFSEAMEENHLVTFGYTVTETGEEKGSNLTSGGEVKITSIDFDEDKDNGYVITIPATVKAEGNANAVYKVTEVELDGGSVGQDNVGTIKLGSAYNLKKIEFKNFDSDSVNFDLTTGSNTNVTPAKLEKVDFTNSHVSYTQVRDYIAGSTDKLETLNLKNLGITPDKENDPNRTWDLSAFTNLKKADFSDNDYIYTIKVQRGKAKSTTDADYAEVTSNGAIKVDASGKHYALTLNISGCSDLKNLDVQGFYSKNTAGALTKGNKGVSFITDGSDEATKEVDLSGYTMNKLTINGAGLEGLTLPSFESSNDNSNDTKADVSGNMITKLDTGSAADLKELDASDNMLLDIDVAGCSELSNLNVSKNFLTSLDVSSNDDKLKSQLNAADNYIPKDNFTKASSVQGSLNIGTQKDPSIFGFGLTGDAGLKSNGAEKASGIIKIGGTANAVVAIIVPGAPEGFAEKYAETITWKEANENGGAITLGTPEVLGTQYKYKGDGNSYNHGQARVFAGVSMTASDVKAAPESITFTIGGKKKTLAVQADNAILISYDTATNLPTNKIADEGDNEYLKSYSMVFAPQQAAILPASGTVSVKLDNVYPKFDAVNMLKGVQLSSWNTSADGTGTSYKYAGAGKGKSVKLSEDTALTAIYTQKTYSVDFNIGKVESGSLKKSGSKPESMKNLNWGDEAALSANGWSSSVKELVKSNAGDMDNTFMAWVDNHHKAYADSAQVYGGKLDLCSAYKTKKETAKLTALWSDGNYSMSLDNTSVDLALKDQTKNTYDLGDLGASISESYDVDNSNNKKQDKKLTAYSADTGVVDYANGFLYAKGEGTATVYVYDEANGAAATVSVTVSDSGSTTEDKLADLTAGKAVKADNGQTVKLNSDGKTVTLSKGKNAKKVTVNTVTIDGVTYKVTAIAANAFKGMSKIQTVVIGNNVKTIGKLAFANCKNLKKVTMGKNVKKIGAKAFKNDKKLAKVLIKSKKLTKNATVGSQAFKNTKSGVKFYIAKKAATFKKIKKVLKKKGQPTKAKYVKKYA